MSIIYSIIIPHRNIPSLLLRCIDSIPKREDTEVIVVDDASDAPYREEVVQIIQARSEINCIMRTICGGGGAARNDGMAKAKGKYLIFADADDFFNDCINDILTDYLYSNYDTIYFKCNSIDSQTHVQAYRANHLNRYIDASLEGSDTDRVKLRYLFGEPWGRIVSAELVREHGIRFDETPIHNDTTFAYLTGYYSKNIHVDNREIYCVTVRPMSTSKINDEKRIITRMEVFGKAQHFMTNHNISVWPIEHFKQLVVLMVRFRLGTFRKSVSVLQNQGYGILDISKGMFHAFIHIVKNKLDKEKITEK